MPASSPKRRFVRVGDRLVHYLRMGEGPPAVLIHSSPINASYVVPHMKLLADRHTCFAFDTPGFGSSQALPGETLAVRMLSDALAANMRALELPACPVFGTHSGAVIGLSLAAHHPDRVTALILDGLPLFTASEQEDLFDGYFQPLEMDALGGHYARTWTRFRDQYVWFPWVRKVPEHHNETDLGSPDAINAWVDSFFRSAATYKPAYRAACFYGDEGYADAWAVRCPVVYTAVESDMLYPHLDRLETLPLPAGQAVRRIGTDKNAKDALIAEVFDRWPAVAAAPSESFALVDGPGIRQQFIDLPHGQVLVRYAGSLRSPPLLLLHDAPGSAMALARPRGLLETLAEDFLVIAPDLPGSGESDPLPGSPSLRAWAAALAETCRLARVDDIRVYGIGAGASVALSLATHHRSLVASVVVRGLALPDLDERVELQARYAPPIPVEADGSHWYRTWLMLRDQQVWFPWYDRRASKLRRQPADFGAAHLHAWTFEVMKQQAHYHALLAAIFAEDARPSLEALQVPLAACSDPQVPFSFYDQRLAAIRPDAFPLPVDQVLHAEALAAFVDGVRRPMLATGR